jgi:CRP-like cAMP-binding protein
LSSIKQKLVKNLEKVEFLKSVPIFSELKDDTLTQLSRSGSVQSFSKESVILSEKEAGSALFIIISGKVKISRISSEDDNREVILSILNPSDFFGEMSLLDGFERSATATAMDDSKIFIIQRNDFLNF